jgi:hypothetical protein
VHGYSYKFMPEQEEVRVLVIHVPQKLHHRCPAGGHSTQPVRQFNHAHSAKLHEKCRNEKGKKSKIKQVKVDIDIPTNCVAAQYLHLSKRLSSAQHRSIHVSCQEVLSGPPGHLQGPGPCCHEPTCPWCQCEVPLAELDPSTRYPRFLPAHHQP